MYRFLSTRLNPDIALQILDMVDNEMKSDIEVAIAKVRVAFEQNAKIDARVEFSNGLSNRVDSLRMRQTPLLTLVAHCATSAVQKWRETCRASCTFEHKNEVYMHTLACVNAYAKALSDAHEQIVALIDAFERYDMYV